MTDKIHAEFLRLMRHSRLVYDKQRLTRVFSRRELRAMARENVAGEETGDQDARSQ